MIQTNISEQHDGNFTYRDDVISEELQQIFGIMTAVISSIGIPGNILAILAVCFNKHLQTAPNFLVSSLSLCDLLFLTLVVPCQACGRLRGEPCIPELCWFVALLSSWLLASSVLSTAAIAFNRYFAIVLQSKYRAISNTNAIIFMFIVVYTLPVILISPMFFNEEFGQFGFEENSRLCTWIGDGLVKTIVIIFVAVCPLIFMTVCYIRILMFVIASRNRVGALGQRSPGNASGRHGLGDSKLTNMLSLVYFVYLITTFPSFMLNVITTFGVYVPNSIRDAAFVVVWTSSAINPVVYGLVNKKYRDAYKSVVLKLTAPVRTTQTVETNSNA